MKIFSAAQLRDWDNYTKKALGISSLTLIENAATACAQNLMQQFSAKTPFVIMCGMGNNGADGLAIAHILLENKYTVKVWQLQHRESATPENKNLLNKILKINASLVDYVGQGFGLPKLPKDAIMIDAILGTGTNKVVDGWMADFFEEINLLPNYKIAIDLPSGMQADSIPNKNNLSIINANETLCLQLYKRSMLHPETALFCGKIQFLDIGLHPDFIQSESSQYQTIDANELALLVKKKTDFSYKNQHGHVFIIGGSKGKTGAAILATKAALRSGVGLVTSIVPEECYLPIQFQAPEAMCQSSGKDAIDNINHFQAASAIGIGIGMGKSDETIVAFSQFLQQCSLPCVIDADALNIVAIQPALLNNIPRNSILSPHIGECDRLFGKQENSIKQVEHLCEQAIKLDVCIVLKGHRTIIITPKGQCYYNLTGNAGMAKGGSGDVLTGLLSGLLAQGYNAAVAAQLGVYLHGLSGDIAANKLGQEAMNANDLIDNLSNAWQKLAKT